MPRFARPYRPFALHHLIGRFVDRSFRISTDEEREEYLHRLGACLAHCDWRLLGYAIMSNHIHLVAQAGRDPSARLLRPLHGGFASWLNRRQGRLGPLFAERHRTVVLSDHRAQQLLAYIHANPVRARVVADPLQSRWTSHRAYVGMERPFAWLDVTLGLALCGLGNCPADRLRFDEEVRARAHGGRDETLSGGDLKRERVRIRKLLGAPVEIGADIMEEATAEHKVHASAETPLRPRWPGTPGDVLTRVAKHTGVTLERMRSRDRSRPVVRARRLALQLWTAVLHRSQVEMGLVLGLAAQSSSELLRRRPPAGWEVEADVENLARRCWQDFS